MADVERLRERLAGLHGRGLDAVDAVDEAVAVAATLQRLANAATTGAEHRQQAQLARLMEDEPGKVFTTALTDQAFRPRSEGRVADQLVHLMDRYGIPRYFSTWEKVQLSAFKVVGEWAPGLTVPPVRARIREEMGSVVVPGEPDELQAYLDRRAAEGVQVNLNALGEAILGEEEADKRLQAYIDAARRPDVGCVSVKISSIASQLEPLAWESTLATLKGRLRRLYRAAMDSPWRLPSGEERAKLVYLDMEEYGDLHLTVQAFRDVLDEPAFAGFLGGLVLQAYVPDSHEVQRALTTWAVERLAAGRAPVRLRLVKGANLYMERVHASAHGWPQAPYTAKVDVDASFKRMLVYGATPERIGAVHLGIASHNVFDVAYAMVVRALTGTEPHVGFEMLEGMADPLRRVVQAATGDVLVYGPSVKAEEIQSAIAYLIRRLDENTDPNNFLRHAFGLEPGSATWIDQERRFRDACALRPTIYDRPRRNQDRRRPPLPPLPDAPFDNEPDTDFSLEHNRAWIHEILERRREAEAERVPVQIGGELLHDAGGGERVGRDPSRPGVELYRYALADFEHMDRALQTARGAVATWGARPVAERSAVLARAAQRLRAARGELIGVMVADGGKSIRQADPEISEAIDFAEYYRRVAEVMALHTDVAQRPRGVVLVTSPWNFPLAIPAGGVFAALAAGNAVLLKPASPTVLTAWHLVRALWLAGVPQDALQFVPFDGRSVGSRVVADPRVDAVVLTGGTDTAKTFQEVRPDLYLLAETGGKNAMVVTALADIDLAIGHAAYAAFGHSGQKCSATSLLICEGEVYDDPGFQRRLADAVESYHVGSAWDPASKVTPLIRPPDPVLHAGLTVLDGDERWLVEPRQDPDNPNLWSPGVKLGVEEGSRTHQTEFFGPVLGVMRADDLDHALRLANGTPYGLTAGLQSLDDREQETWLAEMDAGNLYLNRGTTGAIVRRQPFGGRKGSNFGPGAKAGGPNYVAQLMDLEQVGRPVRRDEELPAELVSALAHLRDAVPAEDHPLLRDSAASYAQAWRTELGVVHDPTRLLGQDNLFLYQPFERLVVRLAPGWRPTAVAQVLLAALACGVRATLSVEDPEDAPLGWVSASATWHAVYETEAALGRRLIVDEVDRVRVVGALGETLRAAAQAANVYCDAAPPLANGRFELVRCCREQSRSIDYHRYGNLGDRRDEERSPVL